MDFCQVMTRNQGSAFLGFTENCKEDTAELSFVLPYKDSTGVTQRLFHICAGQTTQSNIDYSFIAAYNPMNVSIPKIALNLTEEACEINRGSFEGGVCWFVLLSRSMPNISGVDGKANNGSSFPTSNPLSLQLVPTYNFIFI